MAKGIRPTARFLVAHPAHFIALGFGSGLAPVAPGTAGSLIGWASFVIAAPWLSTPLWCVLLPAAFGLGVWACQRTGDDLGVADHGAMVWDEIVAIWLVLFLAPVGLAWQVCSFILFRLFDIAKPPPIGWLDRHLKGGFGVMIDDVLAAVYALFALWGAAWAWEQWHG